MTNGRSLSCATRGAIIALYLLDWCYCGKCCADPPGMSKTEMTKGPSVFLSDKLRRYDHTGNFIHDLRFAHLRICDNEQMLIM